MKFLEAAVKVFKLDEGDGEPGREGMPYRDSKGLWTIGRGHFIGERLEDLWLSPAVISAIFQEDLDTARLDAIDIFTPEFFYCLEPARQIAIVSMLFTLGYEKFLKFHETIAAIKTKDWDTVSARILQTKWARDVDPKQRKDEGRDDRIAYMFRTGYFHPDYGVE